MGAVHIGEALPVVVASRPPAVRVAAWAVGVRAASPTSNIPPRITLRKGDLMADQTPASRAPRLSDIRVRGLFGVFNHFITLKSNDGITIIHGPNGVGKTRLLQLVAALAGGRLSTLRRTPFENLELVFDDGSTFLVEPAPRPTQQSLDDALVPSPPVGLPLIHISLTRPGGAHTATTFPSADSAAVSRMGVRDIARNIDLNLPFLTQLDSDTWEDGRTGELLSLDEIMERYGAMLPFPTRPAVHDLPEEITRFLNQLSITFIDTQRLTIRDTQRTRASENDPRRYRTSNQPAPFVPTVHRYAQDLSRQIERHLADYAGLAARLDRTFPQRALRPYGPESESEAETIRAKYDDLKTLRDRLTSAGILEPSDELEWPARTLKAAERHFLNLYFDDTRQKLSVFAPLLEKLELLVEMLDKRFLFKSMRIDRERGYYFLGAHGHRIPPSALSSGEQHELVFAYRLLFEAVPGSLILIDEPEISLNVAWQQGFIRDLMRIRKLTSLEFLIATHSPQIIHDRWDLAQALGESLD